LKQLLVLFILVIVVCFIAKNSAIANESVKLSTTGPQSPAVVAKKVYINYGISENVFQKALKEVPKKVVNEYLRRLKNEKIPRAERDAMFEEWVRKYKEDATKGELMPASQAYSDIVTVYLGGSVIFFPRDNLKKGQPINVLEKIIKIEDTRHDLYLKRDGNKLLVSGKFRTLDNKIVAELEENKWIINPSNRFTLNYDDSSLEVTDPYDIPALQVMLIDNSTIRICGILVSGKSLIVIHDTGFTSTPLPSDVNLQTTLDKHKISLTPIFKKASFGQRTDYSITVFNEYKRRVALKNSISYEHSRLNNKQLAERAVNYVQELREFRQKHTSQHTNQESVLKEEESTIKEFRENMQLQACSLRNEICKRLTVPVDKTSFVIYENPNNLFCIDKIADNLESLTKIFITDNIPILIKNSRIFRR
jgi:hypothetical protein